MATRKVEYNNNIFSVNFKCADENEFTQPSHLVWIQNKDFHCGTREVGGGSSWLQF